jgi:hypothetical protein
MPIRKLPPPAALSSSSGRTLHIAKPAPAVLKKFLRFMAIDLSHLHDLKSVPVDEKEYNKPSPESQKKNSQPKRWGPAG